MSDAYVTKLSAGVDRAKANEGTSRALPNHEERLSAWLQGANEAKATMIRLGVECRALSSSKLPGYKPPFKKRTSTAATYRAPVEPSLALPGLVHPRVPAEGQFLSLYRHSLLLSLSFSLHVSVVYVSCRRHSEQ